MRITANCEAVTAVARAQVGYRETPRNRTRYGEWFGWNGVPWCAIFVSWCFAAAGHPLPAIQTSRGVAGVAVLRAWAQRNGCWRPRSGYRPKRGDLVVFTFSHVGIVLDVLPDGRVHTCEGNTNGAGSRTGGMVREQYRSPSRIAGYVEVACVGAPPPPPPPTAPTDPAAVVRFAAASTAASLGALEASTLPLGPATPPGNLAVALVQRGLNIAKQAGLAEDGIYGDATIRAVVRLQEDVNRLLGPGASRDPVGIFGPYTLLYLVANLQSIAGH